MRRSCRGSEQGFILVTVLFIVLLLLSTATSFAWFTRQEMRRAQGEEFALQARSLAVVASAKIAQWIAEDNNEFDSLLEMLYSPEAPKLLRFDDWSVIAAIKPLDHLIPINNLFLPDGVTLRKEYQHVWNKTWELLERDDLSDILLDFLDRDTIARTGSREEEYFPNRPISDLSELLRLPEINAKLIYGDEDTPFSLDKIFTVYGDAKINVNLTPKSLLAILDEELDESKADSLIELRSGIPLRRFADLLLSPGFPRGIRARMEDVIGYKSAFFEVDLRVLDEKGRERNYTVVLNRSGGGTCRVVSWRE